VEIAAMEFPVSPELSANPGLGKRVLLTETLAFWMNIRIDIFRPMVITAVQAEGDAVLSAGGKQQ
jgi:hypothetical protein